MNNAFWIALAAGGLLLAAAERPATAQPFVSSGAGMPNLAAVAGKPLPDRGMATGTVSVRVARKVPANAVADTEVRATIRNTGGDLRTRTAKTDGGGRAIFEGMVPGDEFHAEVKVDGETLRTESFTMPPVGGVRTMLISGLGSAPAPRAPEGDGASANGGAPKGEGDEQAFSLGATAGAVQADPTLPDKTLEIRLADEQGSPIGDYPVALGLADTQGQMRVLRGKSDGNGVVRFPNLAVGRGTGYAAVIQWRGLRLGTAPFAMPEHGGARGEIRALARTADPHVIAIGQGGRIVFQLREDRLQVLEFLPLENTSDKMFDPGPGAFEIPLPREFVGAEAREGERKIDVRQGHGIAVHGPIVPRAAQGGPGQDAARNGDQEVVFGFELPFHGDSRELLQPMPNGMGAFTLIIEKLSGADITVEGRGVGPREVRDLNGRPYWVMPVAAVSPGESLQLTLHGLPSTDSTGRNVAGGLALGLVAAAVAFARPPKRSLRRKGGRPAGASIDAERARLIAARESLYADLVVIERERLATAAVESAATRSQPAERRKQLVARLEQTYRDLATLDEEGSRA